MPITIRLVDSKPGSIACASCMLRTNRPAPMSATRARATWETTRTPRIRPPPMPPLPCLPPCLRTSFRSGSDNFQAGITPKSIPVRTVTPKVNIKTVPSNDRFTASWFKNGGRKDHNKSRAQNATKSPATPPTADRTMLSVRSCRISRLRPAPNAVRIPTSRPRIEARARSRLARFTQAISNTKPTAPISRPPAMVNPSRWLIPIAESVSGTSEIVRFSLSFGNCSSNRLAMVLRAASASPISRPGLIRPNTLTISARRSSIQSAIVPVRTCSCILVGIQILSGLLSVLIPLNPGVVTPITVYPVPLSVKTCPISERSEPNCRAHRLWLITATGWLPRVSSSSARKVRPSSAFTPRTSK